MDNVLLEKQERVVKAIEKYADMIRRVSFMYLRNRDDVEDIFQDVFFQLYRYEKSFDSPEHEKAWLLRVAINRCKDLQKSFFKSRVCPLEDTDVTFEDTHESDVLREVLALPQTYKDVIYLFYYEGYAVPEISKILGTKENTIYSHLHRARQMLKNKLGE